MQLEGLQAAVDGRDKGWISLAPWFWRALLVARLPVMRPVMRSLVSQTPAAQARAPPSSWPLQETLLFAGRKPFQGGPANTNPKKSTNSRASFSALRHAGPSTSQAAVQKSCRYNGQARTAPARALHRARMHRNRCASHREPALRAERPGGSCGTAHVMPHMPGCSAALTPALWCSRHVTHGSAQAPRVRPLSCTRATRGALACAKASTTAQTPWSGGWLSVVCWPVGQAPAQARGLMAWCCCQPGRPSRASGACGAGELPGDHRLVRAVQPAVGHTGVPALPAAAARGEGWLLRCGPAPQGRA